MASRGATTDASYLRAHSGKPERNARIYSVARPPPYPETCELIEKIQPGATYSPD
jgi:hypothetical protein